MKLLISSICILTLLFSACSGSKNIKIEGTFKNLKQGKMFVYSYSPEWNSYDTLYIENGDFSFEKELQDTAIIILQQQNYLETLLICIPGKTTKIEADANNLSAIQVSGSEENELLSQFQQETYKLTPKEKRIKAEEFILKNADSYAAIAVFEKEFLDAAKLNLEKIDKYLKLLMQHHPGNVQLQALQGKLGPLTHCRPGQKLPAFKVRTLKNENISNATFAGKWLFINLWATWGSEYYRIAEHAHQALKPYRNKVNILNICLDEDTIGCMSTIQRDTLTGYNVCDKKVWDSPLVKKFGVRFMPTCILVNEKGIVVARDIKSENLEEELHKHLH